jgi:long-chain fatty acid transport protein
MGASYRSKVKIDFTGTADFTNLPPEVAPLFPGGDVTTAITTPSSVFVGVAVKPVNNLELELDYQATQWSSYDKLAIDFTTQTSAQTNQIQEKNYQDTYMIRFAAEYTYDAFQLRAGYIYDHTPVDDAYVDPMLPDANRHDFTVGIGYKLSESIQLDAAYMFVGFKERTVIGTVNNFDGTYNSTANLFGVDISYKF